MSKKGQSADYPKTFRQYRNEWMGEGKSDNINYCMPVNIGIIAQDFATFDKVQMKAAVDKILKSLGRWFGKFKVKNSDKKIAKLTREFRMFLDSNRLLMQNKKRVVIVYALVFVQVLLILSVPFFVYLSVGFPQNASSLGLPVGNWFDFVCIQSFVLFTSNLIPLPGASGGAEAAFAMYYGSYFGDKTMTAIVLWRTITYYGTIILTAPFSYYTRGHKQHAKDVEDELNELIDQDAESEHTEV